MLLVSKVEGQEIFQKIFFNPNGCTGLSLVQTDDNGFLIAGYTNDSLFPNHSNSLIIGTDSSGNLIWNKTFGNNYRGDLFQKIIKTQDGNYVVVGSTGSCGPIGIDYTFNFNGDTLPYNISIFKIDTTGTVLWSYCYGDTLNDFGNDIVEDSNGDLIIIASINQTLSFFYDNKGDIAILRLDQNGILKWSKNIYSATGFLDNGDNICKGPDGGFYISGRIADVVSPSIETCYILLADSVGSVTWSKLIEDTIGISYNPYMTENDNGGVILAFSGFTNNSTSGYSDMFIINFDAMGNIVWTKKYGNNAGGWDIPSALLKTDDNHYLFASQSRLFKTDNNGNHIWSHNISSSFSVSGSCIYEKSDKGFAIIGGTSSILPFQTFFVNMDSLGNNCDGLFYTYPNQTFTVPVYNYNFIDSITNLIVDSDYQEQSIVISDSTFCLTVTSIKETLYKNHEISAFPNPFISFITISFNNCNKSNIIEIYDLTGIKVYDKNYIEPKINLDFLASGFYVLKIISNSQIIEQPIIKQ